MAKNIELSNAKLWFANLGTFYGTQNSGMDMLTKGSCLLVKGFFKFANCVRQIVG